MVDGARIAAGSPRAALRVPRTVARCLPIDARRPASWLGLACVLGAAALSARPSPFGPAWGGDLPPIVLALVAGACAAVAAVGDVPVAAFQGGSTWCLVVAVAASRAIWPLAGGIVLLLGGWACGGWIVTAVLGASASVVTLRRAGADAPESAGMALAAACVAAGCVAVVTMLADGTPSVAGAICGAVTGWMLAVSAGLAWIMTGSSTAADGGSIGAPSPAETVEAFGWPAGSGRLGNGLVVACMIAALLAMAAWLFLAPDRSRWYGALAAGCFIAVAVPRTTLAWGAVGSVGRSRLLATAASAVDRRSSGDGLATASLARWLDRWVGSDRLGPEWRVPLTTAAMLAWPPLVAAGVVGGEEAADRLRLAGQVVGWGAALAFLTAVLRRIGTCRETALAVALLGVVAWTTCTGGPREAENTRNGGRNGVEESGPSCETPHPHRTFGASAQRVRTLGRCTRASVFESGFDPRS